MLTTKRLPCLPPKFSFQFLCCSQDEWEKLWDEEVAETEDDVMALAVSFLLVQACLCTTARTLDVGAVYQVLRFGISGQLPNSEADEHSRTVSS